ncbi:hypothetical protein SARC_11664, partial [Sphaeroforma arctica JP610]
MFAGERRDRGGTRGGQAEFKWSDVKDDKHRENYLGHSLNAPVGRWQNKRDLQWFSRDKGSDDAAVGKEELKRRQEMTLIKQQEQEAMSLMLYVCVSMSMYKFLVVGCELPMPWSA